MLHVWKLDFEQNHAEPDPIIIISQTSIFTSLTLVGPPSRECAKNLAMEPAEWPWPVRSGNWGRFWCQLPSPATWMKFGHLGLPNTCNTKEPQQGLCYVGYVVAQCVVMFLFVTLTNWCNDFKHLLKTKAYVWDVSLPFVFLFMSACGFSLLMLTFGKRYHPPHHMLIFSVI